MRMLAFLVLLALVLNASAEVAVLRVPNGGIQPQAAVGPGGTLHLIYYKGQATAGDLLYVRQPPRAKEFSTPIQINSKPGSAIAAGTIRGAQMALGRDGRIHVAWNGPAPKDGTYMDAPMLYTRLNDAGTAFELERNLITKARGLDGGGSVAADAKGNVFVMWHAPKPGNTNGEPGRAVFVARSTDDGKTFAPEKLATSEPTGACGCCGMKAFADSRGHLFALFRGATESGNRDEILLTSADGGENFKITYQHGWKVPTCPMSSAFISESPKNILIAAETHGRIFFIGIDPNTASVSSPYSPELKAKHPVVVSNKAGQILLAWAEGTGWAKGGSVAWQIFDDAGVPKSEIARAAGLPVWSLPAAVATPDNRFIVIY